MPEKKTSETIAQQRKARRDFLELKKMQSGEMETGPKPSEVAIVPKTFKEKLQNYWFHFKWYTLGTIFAVVVIAILVCQCANKVNYDMKVMYFTYTPVLDEQTEGIENYFKTLSKDINGDGEVNIQVVNCSMSLDNGNYQYNHTNLSRVQSILAADEETLLYITDAESIKYFNNENVSNIFEGEPLLLNKKFYKTTESKDFGPLPEGLQISLRRVSDTLLDNNETAKKVLEESKNILGKLK